MLYVHRSRQRNACRRFFGATTHRSRAGFSLIELLVTAAIFTIVFGSLLVSVRLLIATIGESKARAGATALSVERLEYIRSLSYDDVGTVGGVPQGTIPQFSTHTLNDVEYEERVLVQYVDDAADGLDAADENGIVTDYKKVKIVLTWNRNGKTSSSSLVSTVIPPGVESATGGGTIDVQVHGATVQPIAGARVQIINTAAGVDTTRFTSPEGRVLFSGAPPIGEYKITVTKSGYSSDQTYTANAENPNPIRRHVTVAKDTSSPATFAIDGTSSITIFTVEKASSTATTTTPVPNVAVQLTGDKSIGRTTSGASIPKHQRALTTDSSGEATATNVEWDTYELAVTDAAYRMQDICPLSPFSLPPSTIEQVTVSLMPKGTVALPVAVTDPNGKTISGASVTLSGDSYPATTLTANGCGQTVFKGSGITVGNSYDLTVTASGYTGASKSGVKVSATSTEQVVLSPAT